MPLLGGHAGGVDDRAQLHVEAGDAELVVGEAERVAAPAAAAAAGAGRIAEGDRRAVNRRRALLRQLLQERVVAGVQVLARAPRGRPDDRRRAAVVAQDPAQLGLLEDELGQRSHLRLAERVVAGALLLALVPPVVRPVAVEVEAAPGVQLRRAGIEGVQAADADVVAAVPVVDHPFREDAVVRAGRGGPPVDQQPRLLRVAHVGAVRVLLADRQDQPVAVDVGGVDGVGSAVDRVGAAADAGRRGHAELGGVRAQPRDQVEDHAGQQPAALVVFQQAVRRVQGAVRGGRLVRVDAAVDEEGRPLGLVACVELRDRQQVQVAALGRASDRACPAERGVGVGQLPHNGADLLVRIEVVELDHRRGFCSSQSRNGTSCGLGEV